MKLFLALALSTSFLLLSVGNSFAQENRPFITLQKDFFVQTSAGKNLEETIVVKNQTPTQVKINLTWQGYDLPKNEFDSEINLSQHSIDFANLPQNSLILEPFSVANVIVEFHVIETLKAGDYYGTVSLQSDSFQQKVNFNVRVLGKLKEEITITRVSDSGKILSLVVANKGNRTSKIKISSVISRLFNPSEISMDKNFDLKSGQKETISIPHKNLLPGFYQVKLATTFGDKQTTQTKLFSFWIRSDFFIFSLITLFLSISIFLIVRKTYHHV